GRVRRRNGYRRQPPGNHSLTISPQARGKSLHQPGGPGPMNVITFASRKGGSGKSTLTAQLAAFAHKQGKRSLVIDADPQGSLTLWHALRRDGKPPLEPAARGIDGPLAHAMVEGTEWVFIDTAPTMWVV